MRSVKGIIIGFLLILLGFAAAQYSLIVAGILSAGGLAAVVVSALPKRAEKPRKISAPTATVTRWRSLWGIRSRPFFPRWYSCAAPRKICAP